MQKLTLTQAEADELGVWNTGQASADRSSLSCVDYVRENEPAFVPDADGEWNWHGASWRSSQFVRDCIAMYLVGRAKPARHDCLAGFELSPSTARELPSTLGLIVSSVEERGMSTTKSLPVWAPDMKFSLEGSHELVGRRQGDAYEEDHFVAIAFGDFDGDGYRDLLLSIRDISAGTYGELRMAVLSRRTSSGILSHVFTMKHEVQ
jgi:hypothetical protein